MIGDYLSRSEAHHHVASPQQANLLNKTAAAAEEFKRLLLAEQEWQEERSQFQQDIAKAIQEVDKQTARVKRLEELRVSEAAAWRKEREQVVRDKEAASSRITALIRELELKSQAEARFNLERKSWAERVERIEKIAADAKQDAKNAGDEVTRLQRAYQDIFSKSRGEKDSMSKELQICQEESADLRQRLHAVQEQYKSSQAQVEAMDKAVTEYRRTLTLLGQERDDLQKQLNNMEHEIGDVLQQLATAQDALESEKLAHAAALEFERSERQRQQDFFGKALQEAEADARSAASQVHAQKLRVVQLERETKRLREECAQLQNKIRTMDGELTKERTEWEQTYQQLTEAIATKEMEQDAAAAHLEIMLRSVAGDMHRVNLSRSSSPTRAGGMDSPMVPSSTAASESEHRTHPSVMHGGPAGRMSEHSVLRTPVHQESHWETPVAAYGTHDVHSSARDWGIKDTSRQTDNSMNLSGSGSVTLLAASSSSQGAPQGTFMHASHMHYASAQGPNNQQYLAQSSNNQQYTMHTTAAAQQQQQQQQQQQHFTRDAAAAPHATVVSAFGNSQGNRGQYDAHRSTLSDLSPDSSEMATNSEHVMRPASGRPPGGSGGAGAEGGGASEVDRRKGGGTVPRYMQQMKKNDTGATAGELARVWDSGLRAGFYGRSDPTQVENTVHAPTVTARPVSPRTSTPTGGSKKNPWH